MVVELFLKNCETTFSAKNNILKSIENTVLKILTFKNEK